MHFWTQRHSRTLYFCGVIAGVFLIFELLYTLLEGEALPLSLGYWLYTLALFGSMVTVFVVLYVWITDRGLAQGVWMAVIGCWAIAVLKIAVAGSIPFLNPFVWITVPFLALGTLQYIKGFFRDVNHPIWCLFLLLFLLASTKFYRRIWFYTAGVPVGRTQSIAFTPLYYPGKWLTAFTPGNFFSGFLVSLGIIGVLVGTYWLSKSLDPVVRKPRSPVIFVFVALFTLTGWIWETNRPPNQTRESVKLRASFQGRLPETPEKSPALDGLPNILLISVDTLRWDMSMGGQIQSLPHLESLQQDSWNFRGLVSTSGWTLPAHASLFSGLLPVEHGAVRSLSRIRSEVPLFPQYLQRMGYQTAAFTDGVLVGKSRGFARGYERFWEQPPPIRSDRYTDFVPGLLEIGALLLRNTRFEFPIHYGLHNLLARNQLRFFHTNVNKALNWLNRREASSPFYLFLHTYQVHDHPFLYPEAFRRTVRSRPKLVKDFLSDFPLPPPSEWSDSYPRHHRWVQTQEFFYHKGIFSVDRALGTLVRHLKNHDLYRDTIIVFLSDHGEGFSLNPRMLLHGKGQVGETLIRVPLIVKPPRSNPRHRRIDAPLQITDVFPLIARLAGFQFPREPGISNNLVNKILADENGRDFMRGSSQHQHNPGSGPIFFVRGQRYKIVRNVGRQSTRFFRVSKEIPSQTEVMPRQVPKPIRRNLQKMLDRLLSKHADEGSPYGKSTPKADPATIRELQGMGYF